MHVCSTRKDHVYAQWAMPRVSYIISHIFALVHILLHSISVHARVIIYRASPRATYYLHALCALHGRGRPDDLDQLVHDLGFSQGRCVAEGVELVACNLAQHPPHNLARPCLGQAWGSTDGIWGCKGTDLAAHNHAQLALQLVVQHPAGLEDHKGVDGVALDVMGHLDGRRLTDCLVAGKRRLDLSRADAVARHTHDVIHTARHPHVSVGIAATAIAGAVVAVKLAEVGGLVAAVVVVYRARDGRPGALGHNEPLPLPLDLLALGIKQLDVDTEEGHGARAGLSGNGAGQGGHDVAAGLCLPVRVHHGTAALAHHVVVPQPGLGVDGLTNRPQHPQRRQVVLGHVVVAKPHQRTDGRGRRVELVDLVLLAHGPEPPGIGVSGHALEHHAGGASKQGAVCDVGVARDPATVGRAPVDVALPVVEHVLERGIGIDHVAASRVHHTLGGTCGPTGVEHEEGGLRVHPHGGAGGGDVGHQVVVPLVAWAPGAHGLLAALPLDHNARADGHTSLVTLLQRRIGNLLELDQLVAAEHPVGCDQHIGRAVLDAVCQGLGREPTEHDRVDSADAAAGQHGHGQLHDHGQIEGHTVTGLDASSKQHVCHLDHLFLQLLVRHRLGIGRLVALPEKGNAVAVAGLDVAVDSVVADIGLSACKPLHIDGALGHAEVVIDHALPALLPVQLLGQRRPERRGVLDTLLVHAIILLAGVNERAGHGGRHGESLFVLVGGGHD
eukprot:comp23832_c0_seq1/m.41572 comp23832_c0_seq1/g.41572  ORF comp23832_c0_seq1/g.41572 comp23832_c0_seq1/m.41572 type:complete len:727 (+) comp23832_c0_seq1:370-2550(+)